MLGTIVRYVERIKIKVDEGSGTVLSSGSFEVARDGKLENSGPGEDDTLRISEENGVEKK